MDADAAGAPPLSPNRGADRPRDLRAAGGTRAALRLRPRLRRAGQGKRHASGATLITSSAGVMPAATFTAPDTRSGFMPSLYACSRSFTSS